MQLIVMRGLSGSGKTWLAQQLVKAKDGVLLHDDQLKLIAPHIRHGHSVVIDGQHLRYAEVEAYRRLARWLEVTFIEVVAPIGYDEVRDLWDLDSLQTDEPRDVLNRQLLQWEGPKVKEVV